MLMKEYVFVSRNFLLLHKLKKGRRLNICQLFTCWTLVEPSQMIPAILVDQLQQGKEASVSRNIVHLFVSKLCWPQAQQYLVPLLHVLQVFMSKMVKTIKLCSNYAVCWTLRTSSTSFCWTLRTSSICFCWTLRTSSICLCWTLKSNKNLCYQFLESNIKICYQFLESNKSSCFQFLESNKQHNLSTN